MSQPTFFNLIRQLRLNYWLKSTYESFQDSFCMQMLRTLYTSGFISWKSGCITRWHITTVWPPHKILAAVLTQCTCERPTASDPSPQVTYTYILQDRLKHGKKSSCWSHSPSLQPALGLRALFVLRPLYPGYPCPYSLISQSHPPQHQCFAAYCPALEFPSWLLYGPCIL